MRPRGRIVATSYIVATLSVVAAAFALLLPAAARAANEPPILAFQARVTNNAATTRRLETYPLLAAYPDRFVDLGEVPGVEALLTSHPGWRFKGLDAKGTVCSDIPVGFNESENTITVEPPGYDTPRSLSAVLLSTGGIVNGFAASPVGVSRTMPAAGEAGRPSDDPMESVRRSVADRLGGTPGSVSLETYGDFDFDGNGTRESALLGNVNGRQVLVLSGAGAFAPQLYSFELASGSQVLGVGDANGDGRPEIVVKTSTGGKDFGLELHAWRGRAIQRVFERRSYGCF